MKKNILFMILGMIIMAGISYGVYAINANQITYGNTTVEGALNDLYTTANRDLIFGTVTAERSAGRVYKSGDRTVDLPLNRGKYFVSIIYTSANDSDDNTDTRGNTMNGTICLRNISCTNNCNITSLGGNYSVGNSENTGAGSKYNKNIAVSCVYYVDITIDNTTVTGAAITWDHSGNSTNAENILINAVPVTK